MTGEFRNPFGLPEWVLVSKDGRVHCLQHRRMRRDGRALTVKKNNPVLRVDHGYHVVQFRIDGKMRGFRVHRLVMLAHAYRAGCESLDVNHKNGIRTDNRFENLEWCTRSENHLHAYRVLGRKAAMSGKPAHNKGARYFTHSVAVIGIDKDGRRTHYPAIRDAVNAGFRSSAISHCLAGRMQSHRGMKWIRA